MISIEGTKTTYTGDGANKTFAYAKTFLVKADLVIKNRVIATGVETLYVLDTDYSISATNDDYALGATVTTLSVTAIPATEQLIVETVISAIQSTDYPSKQPFPNQSTEDALDRLTLLVQQLERRQDECLRVADTDAQPGRLGNSVTRADKFLAFDANGLPVFTVTVPPASSDPINAPAITSGAGLPGSAPAKVGDIYIDLTADIPYVGVDTLASTDFRNVGDIIFDTTPTLGGPLAGGGNAITGISTIDTSGGYKVATVLILDADDANDGIFVGRGAGSLNAAADNTAVGRDALNLNVSGTSNTAIGKDSLAICLGTGNTSVGAQSLALMTSGGNNTAIGLSACAAITTASNNTAIGQQAMASETTGFDNVAVGRNSMLSAVGGQSNTALGANSLRDATSNRNVAIGDQGLNAVTSGGNNIGIGWIAGSAITTGVKNLVLGYAGGVVTITASNQLNIGNVLWGTNCSGTGTTAAGQLSIGTNTPAVDTILELSSTTMAFTPPRMTTAQRDAIGTPAAGMMLFNTTTDRLQVVNNATAWEDTFNEGDPLTALLLAETTTPTPVANHGKIYTKSDNFLYFQDGAGIESVVGGFPLFKSFSIADPGAAGVFYVGGFYLFAAAASTLTIGGTVTRTFGTAGQAHGAHAFCVASGAGGTDLVLTVSGISIDDNGTRTPADSEIIVADTDQATGNQYFETTKKWLGQITYTLTGAAGAFQFNYGFTEYENFVNRNFILKDFEATGEMKANETGLNIEVLVHDSTKFTFSAGAFSPNSTPVASLGVDYSTDNDVASGDSFAYKRHDLNATVAGASAAAGVMIRVTTAVNNSIADSSFHIGVQLD
jgi:hypothetical protein